jgi:hypothetical protein
MTQKEDGPPHFRGIPAWAKLTIIFVAILLGSAAVAYGLINAGRANVELAFSERDAAVIRAVTSLAGRGDQTDVSVVIHTLNVIAHLKAITNNQSLATLAISGGAALIAVGFALFLIGSDGAFQMQYETPSEASGKLALYATAPGLLCFLLGAVLIAVGSTRKHELAIGDVKVAEANKTTDESVPRELPRASNSSTGRADAQIQLSRTAGQQPLDQQFCVDADLLVPMSGDARLATSISGGKSRASGSLLRQTHWLNGTVLTIGFLDGEKEVQDKVVKYANEFLLYAPGMKLQFISRIDDAMVRVSFKGSFSWSAVGRDHLMAGQGAPSMNLGNIGKATSDEAIRALVYHEFGHLLGMRHALPPNPQAIKWKRERIVQFFSMAVNEASGPAAADKFIKRYSSPSEDPFGEKLLSFAIPKEFTRDGFHAEMHAAVSEQEKAWLSQFYPAIK